MDHNRYDSLFQFYSESLDWKLLKAQAIAESDMNPSAVSPAGASGLCQFMYATFQEVAQNVGLVHPSIWNPEHQIHCQAAMMAYLYRKFDNLLWALAAYNCGEGRVKTQPWPVETQAYVKKILALQETL
jgi:membrane-bound lytic murein transglycosylase D